MVAKWVPTLPAASKTAPIPDIKVGVIPLHGGGDHLHIPLTCQQSHKGCKMAREKLKGRQS